MRLMLGNVLASANRLVLTIGDGTTWRLYWAGRTGTEGPVRCIAGERDGRIGWRFPSLWTGLAASRAIGRLLRRSQQPVRTVRVNREVGTDGGVDGHPQGLRVDGASLNSGRKIEHRLLLRQLRKQGDR